ncbi:MAG TPA: ABC-2 family transporter protein [Candidatus Eremiobacteraeota bacterium]|nr:ABC-2 family transporter protein [Candidatus Eremiobacteraeota bacterium]
MFYFKKFSPYFEYLRVAFLTMLAYRIQYFIGVINYLIHVAVYYFIYKALYTGGGNINNYSLTDMATYIAIGWISKSLYLNYLDHDIADEVKSGKMAIDLIKPVDYQVMNYARGLGQSAFRLLFFMPPVLVATFVVFPVHPPSSIYNLFLFFLSTFLSLLIYLGINFFMGLISIYTISIEGILYPKNMMIELFSGLMVPIDWFPLWFQHVSSLLPFKYIAFVPLNLYLGRIDVSVAYSALLVQLLWVIILFAAGRILWLMCRKKIVIHGG